MEDLRFDIVKLLLAHGIPAPELVPTARDVLAFVSEQAPQADVLPMSPHPVVDNKKPEPAITDAQLAAALQDYDDYPREAAAIARQAADGKEPPTIVRWKERVFELERWCASGVSYVEIARHFGTTAKGIEHAARRAGISIRWPRRGGKPMFTPVPLDAPWPGSQTETGVEAEAGEAETGIAPVPDTVPAREVRPARRARRAHYGMVTPHTPAQAIIVDWLREHGIDLAKIDGVWRWEQETGLTFRQILGRANNLRIRRGLSPFADPEPDPLALPVGADGASICGSSLANVG